MVPRPAPKSFAPASKLIAQEVIEDFKRARVVRAVTEVAHELSSVNELSVELIIRRATMARSTFYELFPDRSAAVRFSFDTAAERVRRVIDSAADLTGDWEERVRSIVHALLEAAEEDPFLIELYLCHGYGISLHAGPADRAGVEALAGALRSGRERPSRAQPGPRAEELVAFGIFSVIAERLRRGESEGLLSLADELTQLAVILIDAGAGQAPSGSA